MTVLEAIALDRLVADTAGGIVIPGVRRCAPEDREPDLAGRLDGGSDDAPRRPRRTGRRRGVQDRQRHQARHSHRPAGAR